MSDQYLGEIRPTGFNFAPQGWALCQGQMLSISQYTALFSLLGTNFGGDGRSTFALPNLCGRLNVGVGQGAGLQPCTVGTSGGAPAVTLLLSQMPMHNHVPAATSANGGQATPAHNIWTAPADAGSTPISGFASAPPNVPLPFMTAAPVGAAAPVSVMQPSLTVNFIIALTGNFPQRP